MKVIPVNWLKEFLRLESAGGILLMIAAALALLMENIGFSAIYESIIQLPIEVRVGQLQLQKPFLLWVNDGLMAVFFMMVGLELKREMLEGELSSPAQVILPGVAAVGGFLVPAGIYVYFNQGDTSAMGGWAIPSATDIAFALGILMLLGNRVPLALKVFLTTIAIFDDLAAIVIIAIFYTNELSLLSLTLGGFFAVGLLLLNRFRVLSRAAYIILGVALWISVLKSGVHATLAGIIVALAIPYTNPNDPDQSPLKDCEHALHPWVAYAILPIFAFANAGVSLAGIGADELLHPVPVGIALGLFVGKQLGVFLPSLLMIKSGLAKMPEGVNWSQLYGVSILTGIGFTMSLFIGTLAAETGKFDHAVGVRLGVLIGSAASAILGFVWLSLALPRKAAVPAGKTAEE
jgi:NhaA family Na+:H+ antiporter